MSSTVRFSVTRHEQNVVHALVVAAERIAGMDAALACAPDHLSRGKRRAERDLLERAASNAGTKVDPLPRVLREREACLAHLAQSVGPEPRQRREPGEREQRLVRRDVRRRLLAPDVLLARLKRENEAAPPIRVDGLADDAAGHAPHVVDARREEAVVRPAVRRPVAGRLPLADRDRAPYAPGASSTPSDMRSTCAIESAPASLRSRRECRRVLETAEEVRLLEEDRGGIRRRARELVRVDDAAAVRDLDDLEAEPARVRLHDLAHLRIQRLGENDLPPSETCRATKHASAATVQPS